MDTTIKCLLAELILVFGRFVKFDVDINIPVGISCRRETDILEDVADLSYLEGFIQLSNGKSASVYAVMKRIFGSIAEALVQFFNIVHNNPSFDCIDVGWMTVYFKIDERYKFINMKTVRHLESLLPTGIDDLDVITEAWAASRHKTNNR